MHFSTNRQWRRATQLYAYTFLTSLQPIMVHNVSAEQKYDLELHINTVS